MSLMQWQRRGGGAAAGSHPFEVIHVGGLYRSANERQVVDLCGFLVSLVGLDKQLVKRRKKKRHFLTCMN